MFGIDDALLGGIIGGGLSFLGNKERSDAAGQAAQLNYDASMANIASNEKIAEMNLAATEGRWDDMMRIYNEIRNEQKTGQVDALGNASYWDDQRGWVTDVHPTSQRLLDATIRGATQDATVIDRHNREREQRMAEDQRREGFMADRLMSEYERSPVTSSSELANMMNQQGMAGYNEAMDRQQEQAMTAFGRQRNVPAAQEWLSNRARGTAIDLADQRSSNALDALLRSDDLNSGRRANIAQQYMGMRNAAIEPWTTMSGGVQNPAAFQPPSSAGASMFGALSSQRVPQQDYLQPNFAPGNLAMAQGNIAGNNWENFGGLVSSTFPDIYDWYKDRQLTNAVDDMITSNKDGLF